MVSGKIAGETAADFVNDECQLGDYEYRWREQIGKELQVSVSVRKMVDTMMRSDVLMNAIMRLLTAEQMVGLQKGTISETTKKIITGIYRTSH